MTMLLLFKACCLLSSVSGFLTPNSRVVARTSPLSVVPTPEIIDASSTSSTYLVSVAASADMGEVAKTLVIALALGGGLIPALIGGNKAMMKTLAGGKNRNTSEGDNPETSLDPTLGDPARQYVEDSGATGPELPNAALLFSPERIPLSDIIAVIGRIGSADDVADWANLPSTKLDGLAMPDRPPMWLPRSAYKVNVRKSPFLGWPVDPKTGQPVGGAELKEAEERRISQRGALIGDAALDAVFDSWTWGASIATPDKVEKGLAAWRPNSDEFNLGKFVNAAAFGRAQTALGAFTFILIQVVAFGTLFIAPALRVFANVDIGFGKMGICDPETCLHLWNP